MELITGITCSGLAHIACPSGLIRTKFISTQSHSDADFKALKSYLGSLGASVPTLYKQYSDLCEPGGVQFLEFGVDPDFSDSIDGLVLVDISRLKARKRKRYLGEDA